MQHSRQGGSRAPGGGGVQSKAECEQGLGDPAFKWEACGVGWGGGSKAWWLQVFIGKLPTREACWCDLVGVEYEG
jgi:hypothetical protein